MNHYRTRPQFSMRFDELLIKGAGRLPDDYALLKAPTRYYFLMLMVILSCFIEISSTNKATGQSRSLSRNMSVLMSSPERTEVEPLEAGVYLTLQRQTLRREGALVPAVGGSIWNSIAKNLKNATGLPRATALIRRSGNSKFQQEDARLPSKENQ